MDRKKAIAIGLALLAIAAVAAPVVVTVFVPVTPLMTHASRIAASDVQPSGPHLGCKPFCFE